MSADHQRGLYDKYIVRRVDGSSERGGKHEHCRYFVLDLNADHDPHAAAALDAYANSCAREFPALAADLRRIVLATPYGVPCAECGLPRRADFHHPANPSADAHAFVEIGATREEAPHG